MVLLVFAIQFVKLHICTVNNTIKQITAVAPRDFFRHGYGTFFFGVFEF